MPWGNSAISRRSNKSWVKLPESIYGVSEVDTRMYISYWFERIIDDEKQEGISNDYMENLNFKKQMEQICLDFANFYFFLWKIVI